MKQTQPLPPSLNDINLAKLWEAIWQGKRLILAITLAVILLGAAYAFLIATPRYETTISIRPPATSDFAQLNQGRTKEFDLTPFTQEQVFRYTTNLLGSSELQQQFLRDTLPELSESGSIPASVLAENEWRISVTPPNTNIGRNLYSLTISANTSSDSINHLQHYLKLLHERTKSALLADARNDIQFVSKNLELSLEQKKTVALHRRHDRIAQLTEALHVAQAIGLTEPRISIPQSAANQSIEPHYVDGSELYNRGTRSLTAELTALKQRKDDTAFISNLRKQESQLQQLGGITYDKAKLNGFRIDGEIIPPQKPTHPKTWLILVLSAMLGLAIGGIVTLLRARCRTIG